MNITNLYNLPSPLVKAVSHDDRPSFGKNEISVTSIIKPAQARAIEILHKKEISQDASDLLWILLGKAAHRVLELSSDPSIGDRAEERLTAEFEGWVISGQRDLIQANGAITDWKITSVYSFLLGDKPEWESQLNLLKWIAEKNGANVTGLNIYAILRDWQRSKVTKDDPDYPVIPFKEVPVEIWPTEKVEAFLRERLALHTKAAENPSFAPCSAEERWERAEKFAVMQKGKKRALRLLTSYGDAQTFITNTGMPNLEIDHRPATNRRCESFCLAAPWCEQRKTLGVKLRGEK